MTLIIYNSNITERCLLFYRAWLERWFKLKTFHIEKKKTWLSLNYVCNYHNINCLACTVSIVIPELPSQIIVTCKPNIFGHGYWESSYYCAILIRLTGKGQRQSPSDRKVDTGQIRSSWSDLYTNGFLILGLLVFWWPKEKSSLDQDHQKNI